MTGTVSRNNNDRINSSRDAILERLQASIDDIYQEIEHQDPSSIEEERLQLNRYQKLGYLANQYRKLQKDTDIDTMATELEQLKSSLAEEE